MELSNRGGKPHLRTVSGSQTQSERSRSGCVNCRSKRIKCDEVTPACGRCVRLQLECSKPRPPTPLRQRRRGYGSIRSRNSWKPRPIVSIGSSQCGGGISPQLTHISAVGVVPSVQIDASGTFSNSLNIDTAIDNSNSGGPLALEEDLQGSVNVEPIPNDDGNWLNINDPTTSDNEQPGFPTSEPSLTQLPIFFDHISTDLGMLDQPSSTYQDSRQDLGLISSLHGSQDYGSDWTNSNSHIASCSMNLGSNNHHLQSIAGFDWTSQLLLQTNPEHQLLRSWTNPLPIQRSSVSMQANPSLPTVSFDNSSIVSLTDVEHKALDYYRTIYANSRTMKGFSWSSYSIFLQKATDQRMIMHLILAISLKELAINNKTEEMYRRAKDHLDKGLAMMHQHLVEDNDPDYLTVAIAFWLLILFALDKNAPMTGAQRRGLSSKICCYIRKHGLDRYWDETFSGDWSIPCTDAPDASRSLLAKVLLLLVCTDVQLNFCGHGGDLAKMFYERKGGMRNLQYTSQKYLELNYGDDYPLTEILHDVESTAVYTVALEQHMIYHKINELFWHGIGDFDSLKREIDALELKNSSFFRLANSPSMDSGYTRLRFQIDTYVCEFYAIRLYHFRCKDQLPTTYIKDSISSFLRIAHRIQKLNVRYSWFDRSLFLVGIETGDNIHRDWIEDRVARVDIKTALQRVWKDEKASGRRLTQCQMKEILCGGVESYDMTTYMN